MLGAMIAGRPFCFVNPRYRWPQIASVLRATDASVCVVDAAGALCLRGSVVNLGAKADMKWLWLESEESSAVSAHVLSELRSNYLVLESSSLPNVSELESSPAPVPEIGCCLFTSGSSGEPKGVLIATDDLLARAEAEVRWFGLGDSDVLLSLLPFSFDVGLNQLLSSIYVGAELVLLRSWLPADIVSATQARRVTGISAVPAIWQDFLRSGLRFGGDGVKSSLRYVTVSGGSLPGHVLMKLRPLLGGAGIFKTYGQTEAFRTASLRPEEFERKPESVGRAFCGACFYVVDEQGKRCPPGEVGEIVHTGLGIMRGYLGNRDLTSEEKRKLRPNPFFGAEDDSRWAVFTGDLGFVDEDGYLYVKGRRDSMLKIQGNRVYPAEVMAQLLAVRGVADAAVVGVKDPRADFVLVAFVVPATDFTPSAASIRKELNQRLPSYMVPRRLFFVEQIPRTATGKPDEGRLREMAEEEWARGAES
jgi:acyl-CoA synthetase (AMP-forming)/AMP-acid ligase II